MANIIPQEAIESKIYLIRGKKVMIDTDLAHLYDVETKYLNKAVKRNKLRFPNDFMYQLTRQEFADLKFQIGTSRWGGRRKIPNVFTEQGVAMLSSVLNNDRAIAVNIQIIRAFTKLREMIADHKEIRVKIDAMERKVGQHDQEIKTIFSAIKQLLTPPDKPKKKIGFKK